MKYILSISVIFLGLLLWLVSNIKPLEEQHMEGNVVFLTQPNKKWDKGLILFNHDKKNYFLYDSTENLDTLRGIRLSFLLDLKKLKSNSLEKIWINNDSIRVIQDNVQISQKLKKTGLFNAGWIQFIIALLSSIICIALWQNQKTREKHLSIDIIEYRKKNSDDFGIFYISTALILWGVIGLLRIYTNNDCVLHTQMVFLSCINNFFFLLSFSHFIYGIKWINENKDTYLLFVIVVFILCLTFMLLIDSKVNIPCLNIQDPRKATDWIDVVMSTTTFTILGYLLANSFWKRNLKPIAWLSVLWACSAVFAQMGSISKGLVSQMGDFWGLNYLVSCIMLNILITALMFSWYTEKKETQAVEDAEKVRLLNELSEATEGEEIKKLLIRLIEKNELSTTIIEIKGKIQNNPTLYAKYSDDVALVSNDLAGKLKSFKAGLIENSELHIACNRIVIRLLELVEDIFGKK